MLVGQALSPANSGDRKSTPSQRATTAVAMQLPRTFTAVRPMSISASAPKSTAMPAAGSPNVWTVPERITSAARGTPTARELLSRKRDSSESEKRDSVDSVHYSQLMYAVPFLLRLRRFRRAAEFSRADCFDTAAIGKSTSTKKGVRTLFTDIS